MAKVVVDPEYEAFKRFLSWACDNDEFLGNGTPESHPMYILAEAEGKVSHALLKGGLREAINDAIERFSKWPAERVQAADDVLQNLSAPTLTEMRVLFDGDLRRIEKRGKIVTERELFLVRNALEMAAVQSNPQRFKKLMNMVGQFEGA